MYFLRTEITQSNRFAPVSGGAALPVLHPCVRIECSIDVSAEPFGKLFKSDFYLPVNDNLGTLSDVLLSQRSIETHQQMIGTDWTLTRQRGRWYPE